MTAPRLRCAHCGRRWHDPLAPFSLGVLGTNRCAACHRSFTYLLVECLHCANECAFSWIARPDRAVIESLNCDRCGRTTRRTVVDEEDDLGPRRRPH